MLQLFLLDSFQRWSLFLQNYKILINTEDIPGGSEGKASAYNAGDLGSIPGSGRSHGEGNGNPLQYSCLENGQRSLVDYSPLDRKESDTTEWWLHFHFTFYQHWFSFQIFVAYLPSLLPQANLEYEKMP